MRAKRKLSEWEREEHRMIEIAAEKKAAFNRIAGDTFDQRYGFMLRVLYNGRLVRHDHGAFSLLTNEATLHNTDYGVLLVANNFDVLLLKFYEFSVRVLQVSMDQPYVIMSVTDNLTGYSVY